MNDEQFAESSFLHPYVPTGVPLDLDTTVIDKTTRQKVRDPRQHQYDYPQTTDIPESIMDGPEQLPMPGRKDPEPNETPTRQRERSGLQQAFEKAHPALQLFYACSVFLVFERGSESWNLPFYVMDGLAHRSSGSCSVIKPVSRYPYIICVTVCGSKLGIRS